MDKRGGEREENGEKLGESSFPPILGGASSTKDKVEEGDSDSSVGHLKRKGEG